MYLRSLFCHNSAFNIGRIFVSRINSLTEKKSKWKNLNMEIILFDMVITVSDK